MKREIIKIDREKCNGCGLCIPNCQEGALQIVDNKAVLISELLCDGLGACIGHCPQDAISIEFREATPYSETAVIEEMLPQGVNVLIAHFKHLKEHNQNEYLKQGMKYLKENSDKLTFDVSKIEEALNNEPKHTHKSECGCPGGQTRIIERKDGKTETTQQNEAFSALKQWPVQMHLINPAAGYFSKSDLLLAADCVAYTVGNFHNSFLKGKTLCIACPKLDSKTEVYVEKLARLIDEAKINTITIMMMEVPCCHSLLQMVVTAQNRASRKVPLKAIVVGIDGNVLSEDWI